VTEPEDRSFIRAILFGPFRLLPMQRRLLVGDRSVRLGSRAMEILIILVEQSGRFINRDELIARVWPNTTVDDAALRVHIAALRKALGNGHDGMRFITNVPSRGYSFIAPVTTEHSQQPAVPPPPTDPVPGNDIGASFTRVIGREDTIASLAEQLVRRRLVTILGPGGIGKTTVAAAVAEQVRHSFPDGVWYVGLTPLQSPDQVLTTIGATLGIPLSESRPMASLIAALRDRQALLVLDNCEHVIDAAARFAEAIAQSAPRVCILATSREPMRIAGELRHRLAPLACPGSDVATSAVLDYPGVQLFVERAAAAQGYTVSDTDLPHVAEICRRLDGVPLALELAAAHVSVLGMRELATRLDDRLALLNRGRRTAAPRHRTLRATLDWSYDRLPALEQVILRRLAVFQGDCAMPSILAVVADGDLPPGLVVSGVASLVDKSLLSVDISQASARYHLLETTHAYALERLRHAGELDRIRDRHARYLHRLLTHAEPAGAGEWPGNETHLIADLRPALDWAFSPHGDAALAIQITAALVPIWVRLSAMSESRRYVEQALGALRSQPQPDPRTEMVLGSALGSALTYLTGPIPETAAAWTRALELAQLLRDTDYQLRALRGLWAHRMNAGDYRAALTLANQFCALARQQADPATSRAGDRMAALILHYLGEQPQARARVEWSAADDPLASPPSPSARFMLDQLVASQALLARILWLQGFPDRARQMAERALHRARSAGHAISQCHALAQAACPVAIWCGDWAAADGLVRDLIDLATRNALEGWVARGRCFLGVLLIRRGEVAQGVTILRTAMDDLRAAGSTAESPAFGSVLAHGLAQTGRMDEARATIEEAIGRSETTGELWCMPDLLQVRAEVLHLAHTDDATVEAIFQRSQAVAAQQGALSYELRTALDLARFRRGGGAEAQTMLASILARFTEGYAAGDLQAARALLAETVASGR
jgi:predicted ATPase/DNA-binding winged helix-turn-helix (wHTH) protein